MSVLISDKYREWEQLCEERFRKLKENEEKLNSFYIGLYDIGDEITPEIDDADVTVRRADLQRDIKSLINYAVGCIFGRYSLDREGLCYAGGKWDVSAYSTVIPCKNNIMPLNSPDDGLTAAVEDFISTVYGSDTLEENLAFIAGVLGGSGTPKEALHSYLRRSFFKDHFKVYHSRPVYWQFSSGPKGAFKALMYLHRYDSSLIGCLNDSYARPRYEELTEEHRRMSDAYRKASGAEKAAYRRNISRLNTLLLEMEGFIARLGEMAEQDIALDLDDGVRLNYEKLKDILE